MPNLPAPEAIEGPGSPHSYRLHYNAFPLFCYAFQCAQDVNGERRLAIGFQVGVQKGPEREIPTRPNPALQQIETSGSIATKQPPEQTQSVLKHFSEQLTGPAVARDLCEIHTVWGIRQSRRNCMVSNVVTLGVRGR